MKRKNGQRNLINKLYRQAGKGKFFLAKNNVVLHKCGNGHKKHSNNFECFCIYNCIFSKSVKRIDPCD